MQHIFISFSQRDSRYMATMRDNLLRIGYRPWIDPKPRPGQDWRFDIDDAIRAADAVLVIVSPAAAESVYVTYEWTLAIGLDIPVIPVMVSKAKMHPRLQMLEHFDLNAFNSEAQFWDYFNREIRRILPPEAQSNQPVPASAAPPPAPAPSAGAPFTRQVMPTQTGHYLVVRRGPGLNSIHHLNKPLVTLGRDNTNDITIDDPEVSRYHLRLHWNAQLNGYQIEDLKSTNGTRINGGPRIEQVRPIAPGSALMLGDTIILSYEVVN
ncbi:MAG: TIR domain-containing protein [Anaerolineae bacterium]